MQIIIHDAIKVFEGSKKQDGVAQDNALSRYIQSHSFYRSEFSTQQILKKIKQKLKQRKAGNKQISNKLNQLSLYLNKDNNPLMFEIYQIVLLNPNGITYKQIAIKKKLQIVNISHYCCRLKKMNFVQLKHIVFQKKVYPKSSDSDSKNDEEEENVKSALSRPFHFHELSIVDNIWINVSGYQSYSKNGVTNQDIKEKVNKTSQIKLIMKLVEQVKEIYKFDRQMVSEGKVFENRYKNVTKQIMNTTIEPINEPQISERLSQNIQSWLKIKFPDLSKFPQQNFLKNFINNQLKDYLTASGVKSAKRTCTPIKLIRYIKILNSLNLKWPQTHNQLKKFLIDEEKQIPNGTMHKRSIVGILNGLVQKGILKKHGVEIENSNLQRQEIFYYPLWQPEAEGLDLEKEVERISRPKKKPHLSSIVEPIKEVGRKISLKEYKEELVVNLIYVSIEQLYRSVLRKAFRRIMFAKRPKTGIKMYEPQNHILSILDDSSTLKLPDILAEDYNDLIDSIREFVEKEGKKQEQLDIGYDVIKIFRKFPEISEGQLKNKLGNNWIDKLKPLINEGSIERTQEGVWRAKDEKRYFL